jgi:hypothetical protein
MRNTSQRIFFLAAALSLAATASALAGPLNGRTYEGGVPSSGVNLEGHRVATHAAGNIVLRVSGNGRTVSVHFSSSVPLLYCRTPQRLKVQSSRPAPISSNGAFKATISQRFLGGSGAPALVQVVTGHFSGGVVHGAIRTQHPECGGIAGYSATAR